MDNKMILCIYLIRKKLYNDGERMVKMKKEIVVINGTGGSGKDTFVSFVKEVVKVKNFSSIDKVKEIAKMVGWGGNECKTDKDRKFLSDLKKLTTEYNDMSFRTIKEAIEEFRNSDEEIMFIHIREPEEIERAVLEFGCKTLLVKRKGYKNIETNYSDAHVDDYKYDYVIENDTLEELEKVAREWAKKLVK